MWDTLLSKSTWRCCTNISISWRKKTNQWTLNGEYSLRIWHPYIYFLLRMVPLDRTWGAVTCSIWYEDNYCSNILLQKECSRLNIETGLIFNPSGNLSVQWAHHLLYDRRTLFPWESSGTKGPSSCQYWPWPLAQADALPLDRSHSFNSSSAMGLRYLRFIVQPSLSIHLLDLWLPKIW